MDGGNWTATEVVSTASTNVASWPSLSVCGDGILHVAWQDPTDYGGSGFGNDIFYRRKPSGGIWMTTEVVSMASDDTSGTPYVLADGNGTVHVAWSDEAQMGGSFLTRTSFRGADLRGAYLRVAEFERADLSGADLRGAVGLTRAQIDNAICDADTRLPDDLITESNHGA